MRAAGARRRRRKRAVARSSPLWARRRIIVDNFQPRGRRTPVQCDTSLYQGIYTHSGSHGVFQLNSFPIGSGNSRTVVTDPLILGVATRTNRWQRCQISGPGLSRRSSSIARIATGIYLLTPTICKHSNVRFNPGPDRRQRTRGPGR